jgi:sterol desaturase/sphingolipid hydroxylase (fatty acid hydroxylase superfamily)
MNPIEIAAIVGLSAYSLYKQSHRRMLTPSKRFLLPAIYVVVGIAVGGFVLPQTATAWILFAAGWLITLATGLVRGRNTRVWIEQDGTRWAQGTALTITLFLVMIAAKFGLGTIAYLTHAGPTGGFGEIIASIGVMMLLQAQIVHLRAQRLVVPTSSPALAPAA